MAFTTASRMFAAPPRSPGASWGRQVPMKGTLQANRTELFVRSRWSYATKSDQPAVPTGLYKRRPWQLGRPAAAPSGTLQAAEGVQPRPATLGRHLAVKGTLQAPKGAFRALVFGPLPSSRCGLTALSGTLQAPKEGHSARSLDPAFSGGESSDPRSLGTVGGPQRDLASTAGRDLLNARSPMLAPVVSPRDARWQ